MKIAITNVTGLVGRRVMLELLERGHACRGWVNDASETPVVPAEHRERVEWVAGAMTRDGLDDGASAAALLEGADVVVHTAAFTSRERGEAARARCARDNVAASLRLMERARGAGVRRFVYLSGLDAVGWPAGEHQGPVPTSLTGAAHAAVEKFIEALATGMGWEACGLRVGAVYGLERPIARSRWYELVRGVVAGEPVRIDRRAHVVHADDVAASIAVLVEAPAVAGRLYDCSDLAISDRAIADYVKQRTGSASRLVGTPPPVLHEVDGAGLENLGIEMRGQRGLVRYLERLIASVRDFGSAGFAAPATKEAA